MLQTVARASKTTGQGRLQPDASPAGITAPVSNQLNSNDPVSSAHLVHNPMIDSREHRDE